MHTRLALVLLLAVVGPVRGQEHPGEGGPLPGALDGDVTTPSLSPPEAGRDAEIAFALQASDWPRAQTLLLEAIEARPHSPQLLRTLGGVFFMQGRPLNAAVAYKKAEALAPLDERSRFTLAMAYVALDRRDWARPELETLAKADAGAPLYPYWLARLDYDDGQYEPAVGRLERALALDPRFVKAHDNLGLCYEALGRPDEALRSFEEAVRLNREEAPPSPWPPLNMGLLLLRLDRPEEAEALLRESARIDPRFSQAHYRLGLALEKLGRLDDAVPELEEAARLDPAYPEPHYALGRVYRRTGEREKSAQALARFQDLRKQKEKAPDPAP